MNLDEAREYFADTDNLDPHQTNLALIPVFRELNSRGAAIERVRAECDRIEQHIAENVPHLEPTAGTMSIGKIRALLRGPSS